MAESQNQCPVAAYREPLHGESYLAAYLHEDTNLLSSANKVDSDGDEFKCTHWKSSCALSFFPLLFFMFEAAAMRTSSPGSLSWDRGSMLRTMYLCVAPGQTSVRYLGPR